MPPERGTRQTPQQRTAPDIAWSDAGELLRSADAVTNTPDHEPLSLDFLDATDDPRMLGRFAGYEIAGVVGCGRMVIMLKGFIRHSTVILRSRCLSSLRDKRRSPTGHTKPVCRYSQSLNQLQEISLRITGTNLCQIGQQETPGPAGVGHPRCSGPFRVGLSPSAAPDKDLDWPIAAAALPHLAENATHRLK